MRAEATHFEEGQPPVNLWLVDDNLRIRDALQELFGQCSGIRCTAAFPSPNHVLSALASKVGPDVILLDIHMGELNGLDAIRPIKSLARSTQVLMLTTFSDSVSETRAIQDGASGFLLKSFPIEKILNAIHEARQKPAPHLKRRTKNQATTTNELHAGSRLVSERPAKNAAEKPMSVRSRLLWVKHCLDMIRNVRN